MVIHAQVDWRTPQQSLEWDTALVRGVVWRICKRYDQAAHSKPDRPRRRSNQSTHEEMKDSQCDNHDSLESTKEFDEHRLVAKADVLIGLNTTEHFLDKRPFLRSLATMLACCSNEKEMESVGSYVKYRLRERTISFAMVRSKLEAIYKKHVELLAFETKVEEFKAAARAKSTWCVHDFKAICRSPSRFYGVHDIPPLPKTQKQIDTEIRVVKMNAVAVVKNAITLVLSRLVEAARPKTRQRSAQSGRQASISRGSISQSGGKVVSAAEKAKQKRDQLQAEARRRELRMQILAPGIATTQRSSNLASLKPSEIQGASADKRRDLQLKQIELLALIEAAGDPAVAQQLLGQKVPRSGFARVAEHLANLAGDGGERPDEWTISKLWKTVYRSRTIRSIQQLEQ